MAIKRFFDGQEEANLRVRWRSRETYLLHQNSNVGMSFATSIETDELIEQTMMACADFLGCTDHREIVFGQNMTSLTIQLASALSRTWGLRMKLWSLALTMTQMSDLGC